MVTATGGILPVNRTSSVFTGNWDIDTANVGVGFLTNVGVPYDVTFSPDGMQMYACSSSTQDRVNQYALRRPFDVNTAKETGQWLYTSPTAGLPVALGFGDSGTKLYVVDQTDVAVYQYNLTTAWDMSTASYASKLFDLSALSTPKGFWIDSTGSRFYIVDSSDSTIHMFTFGTAWDISTLSGGGSPNATGDLSGQVTTLHNVAINSTGTKMVALDNSNATLYQYTLSPAWDITSPSYDSVSVDVKGYAASGMTGLYVDSTGENVVISSSVYDRVYWYQNSTGWDFSTCSLVGGYAEVRPFMDAFRFNDDGTKLYVLSEFYHEISQYELGTAWNATSAGGSPFANVLDVGTQENDPRSMDFSADGTKLYVLGDTYTVYQYTLSPAWDISSASYSGNSFNPSELGIAQGVKLSSDGTKLYITGHPSFGPMHQYTLSTPWDISTATFSGKTLDLAYQNDFSTFAYDIEFAPDGKMMYVLCYGTYTLFQYALKEAWNIQSGSYIAKRKFEVGNNLGGVVVKPDNGTTFYLGTKNSSPGRVHRFEMFDSKKWEIDNALYSGNNSSLGYGSPAITNPTGMATDYLYDTRLFFSDSSNILTRVTITNPYDISSVDYSTANQGDFSAQLSNAQDLQFDNAGTKLWVADANGVIYQYTLSFAWTLSTGVTYDSKSFNCSAQEPTLRSMYLNDLDYDLLYVIGDTGRIYQYTLGTAKDISTASYTGKSLVIDQEPAPKGLFFDESGNFLYVVGDSGTVYQYRLAKRYDVSSGTYMGKRKIVTSEDTSPLGIVFNYDGSMMRVLGGQTNAVYDYDLDQ